MTSIVIRNIQILRIPRMMSCNCSRANWLKAMQVQQDASRRSLYSQVLMGSAAGFGTSLLVTKFGQQVAVGIGGTILFLEIASIEGLLDINWHDVSQKVNDFSGKVEQFLGGKKSNWLERGRNIATSNVVLAISFIGGAFLGFGLA